MQELEKILEEIDMATDEYGMVDYINDEPVISKNRAKDIIRRHMKNEEDILKFYYCESEDDYYIGQRVQNMYYARYAGEVFTWFMSRYLPWGEGNYPSEPKEIPFMEWIEGFIRKHMNDENTCGNCSRRKWYQIGYEDGKKNNDGWIPVYERLPEDPKENPVFDNKPLELYLVDIGGGYPLRAFWNGKQFTDGWSILKVIAWRPLPEPYRPERSNDEKK